MVCLLLLLFGYLHEVSLNLDLACMLKFLGSRCVVRVVRKLGRPRAFKISQVTASVDTGAIVKSLTSCSRKLLLKGADGVVHTALA